MSTASTRPAFSSKSMNVIACGVPVTGFATGTYLSITPESDIANHVVGADGEIDVNLIANSVSSAKIRLRSSNPAYALLKAVAVAFQSTGLFLPSAFYDTLNVTDGITAVQSHIKRHSDQIYAVEASDQFREYEIVLHNTLRI